LIFLKFFSILKSDNQAKNFFVIKKGREKENSHPKNRRAGTVRTKACGEGKASVKQETSQKLAGLQRNQATQFTEEWFTLSGSL